MFSQFVFVLKIKISFFGPHEISVLIELTLGHLRYHLTDVPPQPNPHLTMSSAQISFQRRQP